MKNKESSEKLSTNSDLLLNFVFKWYHKICERFYRNFGLYEKSPDSFLPGLPSSIINQFRFYSFLCLCLASVPLPHQFHLAFSFSVTPFRSASDRTISSMRFPASTISAQYCLTHTREWGVSLFFRCREIKRLRLLLHGGCQPAQNAG